MTLFRNLKEVAHGTVTAMRSNHMASRFVRVQCPALTRPGVHAGHGFSCGSIQRAAWSSFRSAADALAQEKRGPVKRLAGLVEYAGE